MEIIIHITPMLPVPAETYLAKQITIVAYRVHTV